MTTPATVPDLAGPSDHARTGHGEETSAYATHAQATAHLPEISEALAREAWQASGLLNRDRMMDVLERVRAAAEDVDELSKKAKSTLQDLQRLRRHGDRAGMRSLVNHLSRAVQELEAARPVARAESKLAGVALQSLGPAKERKRKRGGESRVSRFLEIMFERDPSLPRSVGPWLRLDDRMPLHSDPEASPATRRSFWKTQLRRYTKSHPGVRNQRT